MYFEFGPRANVTTYLCYLFVSTIVIKWKCFVYNRVNLGDGMYIFLRSYLFVSNSLFTCDQMRCCVFFFYVLSFITFWIFFFLFVGLLDPLVERKGRYGWEYITVLCFIWMLWKMNSGCYLLFTSLFFFYDLCKSYMQIFRLNVILYL